MRASLKHARQTGNYLVEAKDLVESRGERWLPWVQENCQFSVSEAQRYMRIADRYGELLAECKDPDKLTMTEALKLLSPKKKQDVNDKSPADRRFTVFSEAEVNERAMDAAQIQFAADSPEEKFVREKAQILTGQVLGMARKSKFKDGHGQAVDCILVALALVQQLKKALQLSLIVRPDEPETEDEKHSSKAGTNGRKPHNRLNGMVTANGR